MRKKVIKILSVFLLLISFVIFTSFGASAKTVTTNFNTFASVEASSLHIYKSSGGAWSDVTGSMASSTTNDYLYYSIKSTESWGSGQLYRMLFTCEIKLGVHDDSNNYFGSFQIVGNSSLFNFVLGSSQVYFRNSDGSLTFCSLKLLSDSIIECTFDSGSVKDPLSLQFVLDFHNKINTVAYSTNFDLSFMYLNFVSASQSEIITEHQNNVKNDIINNQNGNADRIIQNQEDNQNEMLNGWKSDSDIDSSVADDYASKDAELHDKTEEGRSEAISLFNSFGSLFSPDLRLPRSLLAVSSIFTEFFKIDWFSDLVNFSLALGVFAFVIGSATALTKAAFESYESTQPKKKSQSGNKIIFIRYPSGNKKSSKGG